MEETKQRERGKMVFKKAIIRFLILMLLTIPAYAAPDIRNNADFSSDMDNTEGLAGNCILYGRISSTSVRAVAMDPVTHGIISVENAHHELHIGNHYFVQNFTDLGNGANYLILVTTPNSTTWAHMVFTIDHELEASVTLTEGVAVDAAGTAITAFNNNRNSSNTAATVFTHTPTNPSGGTVILSSQKTSGQREGGEVRQENEIIMKSNTKYLFTITNATASNNLVSWHFSWYEHADISQ